MMKSKGKRLEKCEWIVILDNRAAGDEKAGQRRGIPRVARDDGFGGERAEREGKTRWTTVREAQNKGSVRTWGSTVLHLYEEKAA